MRKKIKLWNDKTMEQVDDLIYLVSTINSDGRCKKEILIHICQAKVAFNKKRSLFTSKNIDLYERIY